MGDQVQEFIKLPPGGAAQGHQRAGPPPGNRPPPPPPAPGGGGPRPHIINAHPGPHMQQGMQMLPPAPGRDLVPLRLQTGPLVQVSDIRKERLTEKEAREELSEYIIFRFEKVDNGKGYDSDGEKKTSTWANVLRTEVRGLSKNDAARQVQTLNLTSLPVGEKKQSLSGDQQRQLEKVLEELSFRERDGRFHTILAQIDHKLKAQKEDRERRVSSYYIDYPFRSSRNSLKDSKGRRRSSVSKSGKKKMERISITAYYKRCPKPEVEAIPIYWQREIEMQRRLPPLNPHQIMPQQMSLHHPGPGGPGGGPGGGMGGHQQGPKGNMPGGKAPVQVMPNRTVGKARPQPKYQPKYAGKASRSLPSSRESVYSDGFSDSGSGSDYTQDSSLSGRGSFDKGRGGNKKPQPRYIETAGHYGIKSGVPPHKIRGHEEHRIADDMMNRLPAVPQAPIFGPQLFDVKKLKADAYAAGLADGRIVEREREDARVELAVAQLAQARPPLPRLQRRPSIRLVHPSDAQLQLEEEALDRMQRFRFEDERRRSDDLIDDQILRAERRGALEERRRREEEELAWEEEEEMLRERDHQRLMEERRATVDYLRRRESASDSSYMSGGNPFAPNPPRLSRRMTTEYAGRRPIYD